MTLAIHALPSHVTVGGLTYHIEVDPVFAAAENHFWARSLARLTITGGGGLRPGEGTPAVRRDDVVNPARKDPIWFHTTPPDRLDSILKNGLQPNSPPTYQTRPEPWVYLSTVPWRPLGGVLLEVDLSDFGIENVGWAFASECEEPWQLRVLKAIEPTRIKVSKEADP